MELMRGLVFIALLFAGSAVGAELRQAEVCTDGTTHQAGYCPAVLSSASCSATGATTGSCFATSDEADGTRYVCATSNNTALTGSEIEACSGGAAVAGATPVAETGSNNVSLSGLTTDAAHYGQIVNESPEGWYSNRLVSSSFTPVDPSSAPYDLTLGGTRAVPFAVTWPTAPTITSEATVTPATIAANKVAGRRITLSPGSYGNQTFSTPDMEIIIQSGVSLGQVTFASGSHRVVFRDADVRAAAITELLTVETLSPPDGVRDLLINGVHVSNGNARIYLNGYRIAVINSILDVGTGSFTASLTNSVSQDIILANTQFIGPGTADTTMRLQSPRELVFVDNNVINNGTYHTFRVHADDGNGTSSDVENAWIAGNQFEGPRLSIADQCCANPSVGQIMNVWFEDNEVYLTQSNAVVLQTSDSNNATHDIAYISLQRNAAYASGGSAPTWMAGSPWTGRGYDVADNTITGGFTAPPTWTHR